MNNKFGYIVGAISLVGVVCSSLALSPYEDLVANNKKTYVGLIAAVKKGKEAELDKALKNLSDGKYAKALKKNDITNVSSYKKVLTDKETWYMIYFDYTGENYLKAAEEFEEATPELGKLIEQHPRAKKYGRTWLQMEWVCYIRGVMNEKLPSQKKIAMVTRIKPEKEELYRTLHQTVWPGVIDQMARSNNRNFSIFFVEIGNELYEFFYFEYVGKDIDADGKLAAEDPCTLRWWKLTDACQSPLPEVKKGIWADMDTVSE